MTDLFRQFEHMTDREIILKRQLRLPKKGSFSGRMRANHCRCHPVRRYSGHVTHSGCLMCTRSRYFYPEFHSGTRLLGRRGPASPPDIIIIDYSACTSLYESVGSEIGERTGAIWTQPPFACNVPAAIGPATPTVWAL